MPSHLLMLDSSWHFEHQELFSCNFHNECTPDTLCVCVCGRESLHIPFCSHPFSCSSSCFKVFIYFILRKTTLTVDIIRQNALMPPETISPCWRSAVWPGYSKPHLSFDLPSSRDSDEILFLLVLASTCPSVCSGFIAQVEKTRTFQIGTFASIEVKNS